MKFSAVIFDWDGTLGKTLHLWLTGYRIELEKLGFFLSDEIIIRDFFYEHDKASIKYPTINFELLVKGVHTYINNNINSLGTYTGARAALEQLQSSGISLALVSSSPRKILKEALEDTGLTQFFPTIVSGDDIMRHKPDPEPFEQAIEVGHFDRGTTLILGDSYSDIIAAKATKIESCLFLPSDNRLFYDFDELKKTEPTYCVETLESFANLVTQGA